MKISPTFISKVSVHRAEPPLMQEFCEGDPFQDTLYSYQMVDVRAAKRKQPGVLRYVVVCHAVRLMFNASGCVFT